MKKTIISWLVVNSLCFLLVGVMLITGFNKLITLGMIIELINLAAVIIDIILLKRIKSNKE